MGDFRKKISCRLILREKKFARKYLGRKFLIVYNAGRKNLTSLCAGGKNFYLQKFKEKILTPTISLTHRTPPPPKVKWSVPWRV